MELQRWLLVLLFTVAQIATGGYASGTVLCVGDDGHLAVESAHASCEDGPGVAAVAAIAPARSCQDLPLQQGELVASVRRADRTTQVTAAVIPLQLTGMVTMLVDGPRVGPAPDISLAPPNVRLSSLRTVHLTI